MKFLPALLLLLTCSTSGLAQVTQTIRGKVIDKESRTPLPGATVILTSDTSKLNGVTTDVNGNFRFEQIPVGKHNITVSFIGYKEQALRGLILTSAKELVLTVELEESVININTVEITATKKEEALNEMATVSARTFDVEETNRYAGSRGDPARMASNFAGVQGADDSRNDIVIRGNSPMGVLWRLENVDIPNPNHFAIAGTQGGPVSIINNKVLSNSDFMTGAFPAEYGNAIAGVFDLKMRNGNNEKHEFTGQFGFLGTELTAEGPVSKQSGASYIANFRYSTLRLFEALNIPIGTSAIPNYKDAAFKLNFPTDKGSVSVFGIGGKSNIGLTVSKYEKPEEEIYGNKDRDQYFGSSMGVVGAAYSATIGTNTFSKLVVAASGSESHSRHDLVHRNMDFKVDSLVTILGYSLVETRQSLNYFINTKLNAKNTVKVGIYATRFGADFTDTLRNPVTYLFETRLNAKDETYLVQPFAQWKWKLNDNFTINTGLHGQHFILNNSSSIEPRAGFRWNINAKNTVSAAAGMHSQLQPLYIYYHQQKSSGEAVRHNRNLDFTRSIHYIISHDLIPKAGLRIKTEAYYQHLYDVPVEVKTSAFTMLNQGTGFTRIFPDSLANKGTGKNYGAELTVEKFFNRSFFFLSTLSVFESKYRGSDGIERDTDFNGNFIFNTLGGKEFKIKERNVLAFGMKITWSGGKRFGPADIEASKAAGEIRFIDSLTNTRQFPDYFRADVKVNYRVNRPRVTHEIGLDLVNVTGQKNILGLTYAPDPRNPQVNPIREEYQLGFLPLFYYKIDF